VAALIIGGLGYLSWKQVQVWRDSETLWTKAVATEPSFMAFNNLGMIFSDRHDYKRAAEEFRMSLSMNSGFDLAHNNLGAALSELADWEAAASEFEAALKLSPALANAHAGLGYARMKQGRVDDAIAQFRIALNLNPGYESARMFLERALAMKTSLP
jgi:tetratricopeptide (TPR) repeat protein